MSVRNWSSDDIKNIIELYTKQRLTMVEIGRIFSTKAETISKILKENQIPINNRKVNRDFNEDFFHIIDTPEKAYYVGLLFADGSIVLDSKGRAPNIRLELLESDVSVLQNLKESLKINSALRYDKRPNRKNATLILSIRSKQMAEDLQQYGIIPNKTENQKELVLNKIPVYLYSHFLRGLLDGDGSIYQDKNGWHINFTSHYYNLVNVVGELLYGIAQIPKTTNPTYYNGVAKITINGESAKKILSILYVNAKHYIARKYSKAMECLEGKETEDMV